MTKVFLYVADPMCSWCWGFSPVIKRIDETFGSKVPIRIMVGGVHPYARSAMTDQEKAYVRGHWEHVHEATGQPFDFSFFDLERFVYDSEPSCRAIVTGRKLDESKTLALLERIQRAFYVEKQNTVDEQTLADLATEVGFDRAEFLAQLIGPEAKAETRAEFRSARDEGATGFPTLLAVYDGSTTVVTAGFRNWESLEDSITAWVNTSCT